MPYHSLYELYYKNKDIYNKEYEDRFTVSITKHIPITIQQYNYRHSYEAFYYYTEEIVLLQEKIMSKLSALTALLEKIPRIGINQFLHACLIEEIKSSNDIEGVHSTRKEIQDAINATPDVREKLRLGGIVNKFIHVLDNKQISLNSSADVRKLFDEILASEVYLEDPNDLPDGEIFRKKSVSIVSETQKIIHAGILPEEKIIDYMDKALSILNDGNIPALIRIAIFHYLFGYIHPFYNGNGRMSRFITAIYLAKYTHPTVALQLSLQIKKQRRQYYKLFEITDSDRNKGDLTPFVFGTLQFINNAVDVTYNIIIEKYKQYVTYNELLEKHFNKVLLDICNLLLQATIFSDDGITLSEITTVCDISENTARAYFKKLPDALMISNTKARPYRYTIDLDLLKSM